MIFGVGTDLLEVARMEKIASRGEPHLEGMFTRHERDYCESGARAAERYAGRFAGKEALLKALGTGWRAGMAFTEIEILNNELGQPTVCLHGKIKEFAEGQGITGISISITHTRELAMAIVILET
jgi:holo-[acyl-carrier protein] synthase